MKKERFEYVRVQTEQGRDAFVKHPSSGEEGRVIDCSEDTVIVENTRGEKRTWDFREVEEISRSKAEWPRRD